MSSRVLIILESGDVHPSGFIRGLIYREWFVREGFRPTYASRLPAPLLRLVVYPPRLLAPILPLGLALVLKALIRMVSWLTQPVLVLRARRYDVVYMSKVNSVPLLRALRRFTRARLVLDFGDAVWLPAYRQPRFIDQLGLVDAVTTDNEMTAAYVRQYNASCTVIPDCPQVEWFDRQRGGDPRRGDAVVLGWVGTPGTVYNLFVVWEALERLFIRHAHLQLRLLGVGPDLTRLPRFERIRCSSLATYTRPQMIAEVLKMDIGLFPLQEVEASRVRGVLKATVYMAGGAAVVASPVGQCAEVIRDGDNGFTATTVDEWEQKLDRLIVDGELRRRVAAAGLATVRAGFTVDQSFAKLRDVLVPPGAPPGRAAHSNL